MLNSRDTLTSRLFYLKIRPRLPNVALRRLGAPYAPVEAQIDAAMAINTLGPVAARGLAGELCRALPCADPTAADLILASLAWSAPESARAVQAISNCLASTDILPLIAFRMTYSHARIWRRREPVTWQPHTYGPWYLLSVIGTDARPFIPTLRTMAAGTIFERDDDVKLNAGLEAIDTLGIVARGDPSAAAVLLSLTNAGEWNVRLAAAIALARLGACPEGVLLACLQTADCSSESEVGMELNAVRIVGKAAREALPWIEQFTSTNRFESAPYTKRPADHSDQKEPPDWLRLTAILAACSVAPEQAGRYGAYLVLRLRPDPELPGYDPPVFRALLDLEPFDPLIMNALIAGLQDGSADPLMTAAVILAHQPNHGQALGTLRHLSAEGDTLHRLDAAYWLWKTTRDSEPFLARAAACLAPGNTDAACRLRAAARLEGLGSLARPLGPALRRALDDPDADTRIFAGLALMRIAPELMPPIREKK
jgi:hypothetical protein